MASIVPFPLYHGSSTHYTHGFRRGGPPDHWPFKEHALDLLRRTWTRLDTYGQEPEFWIQNILAQRTGPANWRHGVLYVTPSERTAVNYAGGGATYGGEILTQCREGLTRLRALDEPAAQDLLDHAAPALRKFLSGGGKPIVVKLVDVMVAHLESETNRDRDDEIARLTPLSDRDRELRAQQTNFRLLPGSGIVCEVHLLKIANVADPVSAYSKVPIRDA